MPIALIIPVITETCVSKSMWTNLA